MVTHDEVGSFPDRSANHNTKLGRQMQLLESRTDTNISTPTSTMYSSTTVFSPKREDFNYCIEGWIDDQQSPAEPDFITTSLKRQNMDDSSESPKRPTSPSKRQRTADTHSGTKWADRVSQLDNDAASSFFKEPSSATSASRAASPAKSVRTRRIQLEYTNPAIFFGPPRAASDSDDGISDTSESSSEIVEPSHIAMSTLEHVDPISNTDAETAIPPEICSLIKRLSEEAADPILPLDIVSQSTESPLRNPFSSQRPGMLLLRRRDLKNFSSIYLYFSVWHGICTLDHTIKLPGIH